MSSASFTILGDVNVEVTITEVIDPVTGLTNLEFQVNVLDDTGSIGDLNALYFDLANDGVTDSLSVEGDDVTGSAFKVDGVSKIDSYTNMNGEVIKDLGRFDGGVQFGTAGIGTDDIRSTTFTLSSDDTSLSLSDFSLQDFGVRLTSVGEEDGSRDGSLKLGDTAPDLTPVEVLAIANDDKLVVQEDESFNFDGFDFLDNGATSLLANDTFDGGAYTGQVTDINGAPFVDGQVIVGSNGGYLLVSSNGDVDFSSSDEFGNNDFAYLGQDEVGTTTFEYAIDGGSMATLTVDVIGIDDGLPLPPPPPMG